jgi:hypothetical protein
MRPPPIRPLAATRKTAFVARFSLYLFASFAVSSHVVAHLRCSRDGL